MQIPQNIYCSLFAWLYSLETLSFQWSRTWLMIIIITVIIVIIVFLMMLMQVSMITFEDMIDRLEKNSGQTVVSLKEAKMLLKVRNMLCIYAKYINTCKIDAKYMHICKHCKIFHGEKGISICWSTCHGRMVTEKYNPIYSGFVCWTLCNIYSMWLYSILKKYMCAAMLFNVKQQGPSRKIGMRWLHSFSPASFIFDD